MRPLSGHQDFVLCAEFSPEGRWLASSGIDHRVILHDLHHDSHKEIGYQPGNPVGSLAFSPDGRWLALGEHHGQIMMYHREEHQSFSGPRSTAAISGLAFSPCGKHLAWCDHSGAVGLWTLGQAPRILRQQIREQYDLTISPRGKYLAAAGRNGQVLLWTLPVVNPSPEVFHWNDPEGCRAILFDPHERTLMAGLGHGVVAWDIAEGGCLWQIDHPAVVSGMGLSADGSLIATGAWDGVIRTYHRDRNDTAPPRLSRQLELGQSRIFDLALSSDGMVGVIAGQMPEPLILWDVD